MSNKYFSGKDGRYIYCDICGQACYVYEATKLDSYTGRGGLVVCPNDSDKIDYGLIPHIPSVERPVDWVRINHTNVSFGTAPLDIENTTQLGV